MGEKLSRLKLHEHVTGDAGLSRLLELESLSMGITGKAALWRTLTELAGTDARLADVDLVRLRTRAQDQLEGVADQAHEVCRVTYLTGG